MFVASRKMGFTRLQMLIDFIDRHRGWMPLLEHQRENFTQVVRHQMPRKLQHHLRISHLGFVWGELFAGQMVMCLAVQN
jgi:hypothetical protein